MKKVNTKVIFRKYKDNGEIIALFPYEEFNYGHCGSYVLVSQHSGAYYLNCINQTKLATPEEYKNLHKELTDIGYNLQVIKKKGRRSLK